MKRPALALSAGILLLALLPGSTVGLTLANLDQSNDPNLDGNHDIGVGGTDTLAQTFTARKSGILNDVEIYMNGTGLVDARIETTTGGLPTNVTLASSNASILGSGWLDFHFASPAAMVAGDIYAIVFSTGGAGWATGSGNTYSDGRALIVNGSWMSLQDWNPAVNIYDFGFKTFVDPQSTTVGWSIPQVVAGAVTPLSLTVTTVFPNDGDAGTYSVRLGDPLPTWFQVTGVTCSSQISPANCTLEIFATHSNGFNPTLNGTDNTFWFTLTGTASPALADAGTTGTGTGTGCAGYFLAGESCTTAQATVAVAAPAATPTPAPTPAPNPTPTPAPNATPTPTPRPATPPPTTAGGSDSSNGPGPSIWFLPIGLVLAAGGALLLVDRQQRRIR